MCFYRGEIIQQITHHANISLFEITTFETTRHFQKHNLQNFITLCNHTTLPTRTTIMDQSSLSDINAMIEPLRSVFKDLYGYDYTVHETYGWVDVCYLKKRIAARLLQNQEEARTGLTCRECKSQIDDDDDVCTGCKSTCGECHTSFPTDGSGCIACGDPSHPKWPGPRCFITSCSGHRMKCDHDECWEYPMGR